MPKGNLYVLFIFYILHFTCLLNAAPQSITTLSALTSTVPTAVELSWVCADALPAGSTFWIQHSTWPNSDEIVWSTASAQIRISTGPLTADDTHYYTAKGLEAGDTHYFRIWISSPPADETDYAVDLAEGATSWAQLIDDTPWAISSLTVLDNPDDGGQQIKLSWTEPYNIEGDTQAYIIYRATCPPKDSSGFTILSSSSCNEDSYTYMDSGLEDGNTYYYIVKSSDTLQESGALQFNGTNDYVNCGLDSSLDFTGRDTFTLEAWVKTTQDASLRDIMHFGNLEVILSKTDANRWQIYARDDLAPRMVNSDDEITEDKWTHVVGVCDALNLRLYIDGVEQSGAASMTFPVIASGGTQSNSIGAKAGFFCFNGTIDDVKVYSRALSADEVYSNYTDMDSVTTNGLISWWKFDNDTADYLQTNNGSVGGGNPYYTVGRKGNVASCYSHDDLAPGGISNLTAIASLANMGEVTLEWTSPGDDGEENNLSTGTFTIKYSTVSIINSSDFDNPAWDLFVTTVTISTDTAVLSYQTTAFFNLLTEVTYYFAIKTADEVPNWSVWNSSADVLTINTSAWCYVPELRPYEPAGLTQLDDSGTELVSMRWSTSTVIISSFTLSDPQNDVMKFYLHITSVTTADAADWSQLFHATTSEYLAEGTTGYQWPTLTDSGTYWWRVWSEDDDGYTSSTSTVLGSGGDAKLGFTVPPDAPSGLTQFDDFGTELVSMQWSTSTVIISSFTQSSSAAGDLKFYLEITSVTTGGDIADWSQTWYASTSEFIAQGTTEYQWPALTEEATYWWRVWSENTAGFTSSTSTVLGVTGDAKLGFTVPPDAPSGLTQFDDFGTELVSMQWSTSTVIISSFTQSSTIAGDLRFYLEITSVTTGGDIADWSQVWYASTSDFISQGTTEYQWPTLTDSGTYWWRVWSENTAGFTSSTSTALGAGGDAKLGFMIVPDAPSGLTQFDDSSTELVSMQWSTSTVIISSFTQSNSAAGDLKFYLEITSVTTGGDIADWSQTWYASTSEFIAQGTTEYQWPTLTDSGTYWWRVWSENTAGFTSSTSTALGAGGDAKLGFTVSPDAPTGLTQFDDSGTELVSMQWSTSTVIISSFTQSTTIGGDLKFYLQVSSVTTADAADWSNTWYASTSEFISQGTTEYQWPTLTDSGTYWWRVWSENTAGFTSSTSTALGAGPADSAKLGFMIVPDAPTGLTQFDGSGTELVSMQWSTSTVIISSFTQSNSAAGDLKFYLQVSSVTTADAADWSNTWYASTSEFIAQGTTEYQWPALTDEATYWWRVWSENTAGFTSSTSTALGAGGDAKMGFTIVPDAPTGLTQFDDSGTELVSMQWSSSTVIISSFTQSSPLAGNLKFYLEITSVTTGGDIADWSQVWYASTSDFISQGTTEYQWPALTDEATYWWRVWSENTAGFTSSTSTVLGVTGDAKLGWFAIPDIPSGLTQINNLGTEMTSMQWTESSVIISSFTISSPASAELLKFYLEITSVTTGGDIADWSQTWFASTSDFIAQGTTGYQWPVLVEQTTYWWRVWSEDVDGWTSSTATAIGVGGDAKFGYAFNDEPYGVSGLTQLAGAVEIAPLEWTTSSVIISSFTLDDPDDAEQLKFYLHITSVTTADAADWSHLFHAATSEYLAEGTTGYQWPALTDKATYWWRVWCEDDEGAVSPSTTTYLADDDTVPAKLWYSPPPDAPSGLTQFNDSGTELVSMQWSTSTVIISSFTQSSFTPGDLKFYLEITSVTTGGDIADWSQTWYASTSEFIAQGTTNYQWPALTEEATYWWKVWSENTAGFTSSTSTALGAGGDAKLGFTVSPDAPSGLTQFDDSGTELVSMQWSSSTVIISSFTQSSPLAGNLRFYLEITSVTTGGDIADWSQLFINYNSEFIIQETTGYQWPALTDEATYWWRVWSENTAGFTSSTSTVLGVTGDAKLGYMSAPSAPVNLKISALIDTATIYWQFDDTASNEAELYISSGPDTTMRLSENLGPVAGAGTTYWYEVNLGTNTAYTRYAEAVNGIGSNWSAALTSFTASAVPGALLATTSSYSSIELNWSANDNPGTTRYGVSYSTNADYATAVSTFIDFASGLTDVTTAAYNLTLPGTTYYFRLWAYNGDEISASYVEGSTTTFPVPHLPPNPISDLTGLTGDLDGEIVLNWTAPGADDTAGNITGGEYILKYSVNPIGNDIDFEIGTSTFIYTSTDTVTQESYSLTLTGLTPSTTYYFALKYRDELDAPEGWASWSTGTYTNTLASACAQDLTPAAPQDLTSLAGSTQIQLSWTANTEPDLNAYRIYRDTWNFSNSFVLYASTPSNYTVFTDTGLADGNTYWYKITAYDNTDHESSYSTTVNTATYLSAPVAPSDLAVLLIGTTSIQWRFMDNASDEAGFFITSGTNTSMRLSENLGPLDETGLTTSWWEINLSTNTAYTRYAEAYNSAGSSWSVSITSYTLACPPSDSSVVSVSSVSITIQWSANTNPSYTRWEILRSTDNFMNTAVLKYFVDNYTATGYTDTGLETETVYYYKVRAFNGDGIATDYDMAVSTETGPVYDATPPYPPSGIMGIKNSAGGIDGIKWSAVRKNTDNTDCSDLKLYRVYRSTDIYGGWIMAVDVSSAAYEYTGLAATTGEYFKVTGIDKNGNESGESMIIDTAFNIIIVVRENGVAVISITVPAAISGIFNKDSNQYGEDIRIEVSRLIAEESEKDIAVYEFAPVTVDSGGRLEHLDFGNKSVEMKFRYDKDDDEYVDKIRIPVALAANWLAVFYHNNVEWMKLGGDVNEQKKSINIRTSHLSKYKVMKSFRITGFGDLYLEPNKIFAPDDPVWNKMTFHFENTAGQSVELKIFDLKGRLIYSDSTVDNEISWAGKYDDEVIVSGGVYIYQLDCDGSIINGTIVVAR